MTEPAGIPNEKRPPPDVTRVLEICNRRGLHARASAKFVMTVEQYDAEVWVSRGSERVGGEVRCRAALRPRAARSGHAHRICSGARRGRRNRRLAPRVPRIANRSGAGSPRRIDAFDV